MRIGLIISKKKINKSEKLAEKDLIELFSQNNNRQDLIQLMMLTQIDILI
jgi:hypothetical protein